MATAAGTLTNTDNPYGLEDPKPPKQDASSSKTVMVDPDYGLERVGAPEKQESGLSPHNLAANRVQNASPTQFEMDRTGGTTTPKEKEFDAQENAMLTGAASGASGLAETQHPIKDRLDQIKAAHPNTGSWVKDLATQGVEGALGPLYSVGKTAYGVGSELFGTPKDANGNPIQESDEDKNERRAHAIGTVVGMAGAGMVGEGVDRVVPQIRNVMPGPKIAPGLTDVATDNLKTGRETRVGNEKIFRAADPGAAKTNFRESLATALPDLKEIELKNPIGKADVAGGIANPDFRMRQTVTNIDNKLDSLWNEQRKPQIDKWKDSNTTSRDGLGLNEDQLKAIESRMGEKIPDHIPLGEADQLLQKVNSFLRRSEALTPEGKALAQAISPVLENFDTMKGALHNSINKTLTGHGEPGILEFNRRYGALSDVRDALRSKMNPVEAARLLDQIKVFGSPTGHAITERLHLKASPGRNLQKGLERLAGSDLPVHPPYEHPAPPPSVDPAGPRPQGGGPIGRVDLEQAPGNHGMAPGDLFRPGFETDPTQREGMWGTRVGEPPSSNWADMWEPNRPEQGPAARPPFRVESPEYTAHLREQDAARQPGGAPPKVGDVGRVEVTRPQAAPEESTTILPDRSGTATKALLPENRVVPSTATPPVPEEFRREYVGPTDFNERSRLGPKGDQGVRGPVLIHDPQPPAPTYPRSIEGRPALGGPIGGVDVPRGTNGPQEIFGGNRGAEMAAVEPELAKREANQTEARREAMRGAADAFESQPQSKVPEGTSSKSTGPKSEFKEGENLVGSAHNTLTLRDEAGKEIGNALLTDTAENGKRGLRVSVSQIDEANRGKGYGKKMYNDIVDHAKEKGYDYVESDKNRTQDADRVWEALKREGKPVRLENGRYVLDVKEAAKNGTANDRPQVKYEGHKPSEKAALMGAETKDLGPEQRTDSIMHEALKNQAILDNDASSPELKQGAEAFFKLHPESRQTKFDTRSLADRNAARGKGGSEQTWKVNRLGDQLFATEPGPNGIENSVSFKEGEDPKGIRKRLDDQATERKKFFARDRQMQAEPLSEEDKAAAAEAKAKREGRVPARTKAENKKDVDRF